METSAVSVIMAARNAERTVRAAVCSILAQDYHEFELVVVDDASSDGTASILAELEHDRLQVVRTKSRLGRSAARNLAVGEARYGLLAVMDADDFALPSRLSRSVALLDAQPELGGVGGQAVAMHNGLLRAFGPAATSRAEVTQALLSGRMPLIHPTMLFRREVVDVCGGYDDAVTWCEDLELFSRAAKHFEFTSAPDVWLLYRTPGRDAWSYLWKTERSRRRISSALSSRTSFIPADAAATLAWSVRAWIGQQRHQAMELPHPTPETLAALATCLAYDAVDAAARFNATGSTR